MAERVILKWIQGTRKQMGLRHVFFLKFLALLLNSDESQGICHMLELTEMDPLLSTSPRNQSCINQCNY